MPEVGHNATSLLGKLSCHFLTRGSRSPDGGPAAQRWWRGRPSPLLIPRSALRFAYFPRPNEVSRHAFLSSCLLQASFQSPFARSSHLALHDRRGVAIWWWDADAVSGGSDHAGQQAQDILPEPVCQDLEDGFHHFHLDEGFEARHVHNGMVIGSAWRRTPFDRLTWQAFLEAHNATPGQIAAGPPIAVDPPAATATRPLAGRRLVRVVHPRDQLLAGLLAGAAVAGAWWHGQAAAFATATQQIEAEASRISTILESYDLMVLARQDLANMAEARATAGHGAAAVRLARVLQLAAGRRLPVSEIRIDSQELDLLVEAGDEPARVRALASDIESMPEFTGVLGAPGPDSRQTRLTAKVTT